MILKDFIGGIFMNFLNLIRNILALVGLVALAHYGYNFYYTNYTPVTFTPKTVLIKKTNYAVQPQKVVLTEDANVQTAPVVETVLTCKEDLEQLKDQAERAVRFLQKETAIPEHTQNNLISRLKEVISHIDHLDKYLQKGPSIEEGADESVRENSKSIFEKTVQRKGLALAHKLETVLAELTNEMTGQTTDAEPSTTVAHSIQLNSDLLNKLVLSA